MRISVPDHNLVSIKFEKFLNAEISSRVSFDFMRKCLKFSLLNWTMLKCRVPFRKLLFRSWTKNIIVSDQMHKISIYVYTLLTRILCFFPCKAEYSYFQPILGCKYSWAFLDYWPVWHFLSYWLWWRSCRLKYTFGVSLHEIKPVMKHITPCRNVISCFCCFFASFTV